MKYKMIHQATHSDSYAVAQMAVKMWTSHTVDELSQEFDSMIDNDSAAIFVCVVDGAYIGFSQCQLRYDYVEGTNSSPVGYLEGVFVEEKSRNQGWGRMLINACEQWAKEKGCTEFASDCELNNHQSLEFHLHCGFREANRIICFTKKL